MGFKRKIKYFLVHLLNISNAEAQEYLDSGRVYYNGIILKENKEIDDTTEIRLGDKIIRPEKKYLCYKFYKPRGYQSTLNKNVENNIASFFPENEGFSIAGRLDKDSEGLLLISDHGKWVQKICDPGSEKEKEYIVELDKTPDQLFKDAFSAGVKLGDGTTKACICKLLQGNFVRVILTEGKNRQIRRMCHKLGYKVLSLKRIRIDCFILGDNIQPGEVMEVQSFDKF